MSGIGSRGLCSFDALPGVIPRSSCLPPFDRFLPASPPSLSPLVAPSTPEVLRWRDQIRRGIGQEGVTSDLLPQEEVERDR